MLPSIGFSLQPKYALPTDGVLALLAKAGFSTDPADHPYIPLPPQEFFARAGEHARKLADMYDRVIG